MEEKKEKKSLITKQTIIAVIIGLVLGVGITCLVGFLMDYFATSAGMAKLKYGDETVATVDGEAIITNTIYEKAKKIDGLSILLNEIDRVIFDDMYELTAKEEEQVKEQAESYISYYAASGVTEEDFLFGNGFNNYEEFLDELRIRMKTSKYLYDCLEEKLEEGAVQKYYDENKDTLETYDSEHMLVKISDEVTDEQALALANEIIGKLNEGKSFEEVKTEYADKIVYEELGYQGQDSGLEQTYVDELVALKDGEYSKTPVKTSYGYHVVHKIATSTMEELRPSIIETLSKDLLAEDSNITYKLLVEFRKEKNLTIYDETIKEAYDSYCDSLYEVEEDT